MAFAFALSTPPSSAVQLMFSGMLFGIVPLLLTLFNGYMIGTVYSRAFESFSLFVVFDFGDSNVSLIATPLFHRVTKEITKTETKQKQTKHK